MLSCQRRKKILTLIPLTLSCTVFMDTPVVKIALGTVRTLDTKQKSKPMILFIVMIPFEICNWTSLKVVTEHILQVVISNGAVMVKEIKSAVPRRRSRHLKYSFHIPSYGSIEEQLKSFRLMAWCRQQFEVDKDYWHIKTAQGIMSWFISRICKIGCIYVLRWLMYRTYASDLG